MIRNTVREIFFSVWPMLLIIMVILSLLRVGQLIKEKKRFVFYQEMMSFGFMIYIMCLFYVVTFQDVSWSSSNFIPFKEMFRYRFGSRLFLRNVLGNSLLFLPYGFFVTYFLKLTKKSSIFIYSLIVSITIEVTQLVIGRVFDIDDIFLNVVGGMAGFYLYQFFLKIKGYLPNFLKKEAVYNIIMTLVLILIFLYLFETMKVGVIA